MLSTQAWMNQIKVEAATYELFSGSFFVFEVGVAKTHTHTCVYMYYDS